ncbi:hypothetical protein ACTJKN_25885 [Pedobacter sp. 22163]|uniref:hypothetical protein n=1 Tax=Pedobacter sp. 22163 TaxID=3453883 RepID=UPI003F82758B
MATYSKGANGAFSGIAGRVIGSNWRSVDCLKGLSKKTVKPVPNQLRKAIRYFAGWTKRKMKAELKLLMACIMIIMAFGTLKSKKTLHAENLQPNSQYKEHTRQQSLATGNTLLIDTSNSEYVVQINPLGKFYLTRLAKEKTVTELNIKCSM